MTILPKPVSRRKKLNEKNITGKTTNVLLKNMVVYDVLTFLQTMAFVCSTCVDLDFGVESYFVLQTGCLSHIKVNMHNLYVCR
jgi:hypothetical protein